MAPNPNGSSPDRLFEITLDNGRCEQVDFKIRTLGSDAPLNVKARLEVAPPLTWLQSLLARLGKRDSFPSARLEWLELVGKHQLADLTTPDHKITLSVFVDVPRDVQPGDYQFRLALLGPGDRPLAHSQWITIAVKSDPFTIQALQPGPQPATLIWKRQKDWKFQVTNTSGAPLQGRVRLTPHEAQAQRGLFSLPGRSPQVSWLELEGQAEQDYGFPDGTGYEYTAHLDVPRQAPAGLYAFSLDAADADNPDERFSRGPLVTFRIPAFPWALAATLLIVLLLAAGIWALRRPQIQLAPVTVAYIDFQAGDGNGITPIILTSDATLPVTLTAGTQITYTMLLHNQDGLLGRRAADKDDVGQMIYTFSSPEEAVSASSPGMDAICHGEEFGGEISCDLPDGGLMKPGIPYSLTLLEGDVIQTGTPYTVSLRATIPPDYPSDILTSTLTLGSGKIWDFAAAVVTRSHLVLDWNRTDEAGRSYPAQNRYDARADEELIYTLTATNSGPSQSSDATLSFASQLPSQTAEGTPGFISFNAVTEFGECQTDPAAKSAVCTWDTLAAGEAQTVTIKIRPGPNAIGFMTNSVTLTDTLTLKASQQELPDTKAITVSVTAAHGLKIELFGETIAGRINTKEVKIQPGETLIFTVGITNSMPITANDLQIDFRVPDPIKQIIRVRLEGKTFSVPVQFTEPYSPTGKIEDPKGCWGYTRSLPGSQDQIPDYWVHCVIQELKQNQNLSIQVLTQPPIQGAYDSSVKVVDHHGFAAEDALMLIVNEDEVQELALRLDGSTYLTTTLTSPFVMSGTFRAEAGFYYDGRSAGRLLAIGEPDQEAPLWSIGVQSGILTMRAPAHAETGEQRYSRCILGSPEVSSGWYEVTMIVTETYTVSSILKAENGAAMQCIHGSDLITGTTPVRVNSLQTLMIGGKDPSSGDSYQGAVVYVKLTDHQNNILGHWDFSNEGKPDIPDDHGQDIQLPPGPWAWVTVGPPVLMPVRITSDSTWKANRTASGDWGAQSGYDDQAWSYAWDMIQTTWGTPHNSEARWIWAAAPVCVKALWFWVCPAYPAEGDVFFRKVIDLPGEPSSVDIKIAGDDSYTLYLNRSEVGKCRSDCSKQQAITFYPQQLLHAGPNTIAIQAHNSAGPAGILVIIEIDFYPVLIIP